MIRRAVGLAAALLAAATVAGACQGLPFAPSGPTVPSSGRIAWPKQGELWVYDFAAKAERRIVEIPQERSATGVTWSPDGRRLAWAEFGRLPGERVSGADLKVADADGGSPQVLVGRDAPATILDTPAWAPSGRLYYSARRLAGGRELLRVERLAEGGQPEILVEDASVPAPFPDESAVVVLRATRTGVGLIKQPIGGGAACDLLQEGVFQLLGPPRVSPDGRRVAFAGSGEPQVSEARGTCGGATTRLAAGDPPSSPAAWFGTSVALAHGAPWDLWVADADGGNISRLLRLGEDEPTVAWSPDGRHVAVFGSAALYLAEATGGPTRKLVEQGGYGGLDWAP